jgi:hypothetical protein
VLGSLASVHAHLSLILLGNSRRQPTRTRYRQFGGTSLQRSSSVERRCGSPRRRPFCQATDRWPRRTSPQAREGCSR